MSAPKINHRLGSEILQPSAISDFNWPLHAPEETEQTTRLWSDSESNLLDRAIANIEFYMDRFLEQDRDIPLPDKIWSLLSHRAFNFNGGAVRAEAHWRDRISASIDRDAPIVIAYPLVCKIDNPAKRLTSVGITAGERAIVRFFRQLGQLVTAIYSPGIQIHILSDATLYNSALQVPPPTAHAYMEGFRQLVLNENAANHIVFYDYASLLAPYASEFEAFYNHYYKELMNSPQSMLSASSLGSLPTSVRASINTRRMGFDFDALRGLFGPNQTRFVPVRAEIDAQAILALRDQLAIKMACDQLDLAQRLWPNHVRATCHRGMKQGRSVLGLRCYPEYYAASRLLPYHGMPLIHRGKNGSPKLVIEPEVSLRSREDLLRILNDRQEPVLYVDFGVLT
jgi:hypothetical protein